MFLGIDLVHDVVPFMGRVKLDHQQSFFNNLIVFWCESNHFFSWVLDSVDATDKIKPDNGRERQEAKEVTQHVSSFRFFDILYIFFILSRKTLYLSASVNKTIRFVNP
jgi:hypothetical protein